MCHDIPYRIYIIAICGGIPLVLNGLTGMGLTWAKDVRGNVSTVLVVTTTSNNNNATTVFAVIVVLQN